MFENFIKYISNKLYKETEKNYKYCRRCGRVLKNEESKKLGLGKCCYKKELRTKYSKHLF